MRKSHLQSPLVQVSYYGDQSSHCWSHWYVQRCFRKPIFECLFCIGYLGNTILRTLLGRTDRTNFDITLGVRDEATANKFRKDEVKVRIFDLDDFSALEQAAEESDGQLTRPNL